MDKKVTGIVAYITWIGWLIAFLAGDKENAKFHLNQSLVIWIASIAIGIVNAILGLIPIVGGILGWLLSLAIFVAWLLGLIYAVQDTEKEVPLLGQIKILK